MNSLDERRLEAFEILPQQTKTLALGWLDAHDWCDEILGHPEWLQPIESSNHLIRVIIPREGDKPANYIDVHTPDEWRDGWYLYHEGDDHTNYKTAQIALLYAVEHLNKVYVDAGWEPAVELPS